MTKFDKRNRRNRKLVHKQYRRYGDIWGRLAIKKRDDFITNLVYNHENQTINHKKRKLPRKYKKRVRKIFRTKRKKEAFAFEITSLVKTPRKKRTSGHGSLLKSRKQVSLFYGGGRIRKKTFRRYGKIALHYNRAAKDSYGSVVESRLDVLLLRSQFVDSIYKARLYIFHRKCYVQNFRHIPHPSVIVKNYQQFGLRGNYPRKLRQDLLIRVKNKALLALPSYLYINFSLMIAFKIEDPNSMKLTFPFSDQAGVVANFRKAYSFL